MSRIRICRINKPGHPLHGLVVNYRDADENEGSGGGGGDTPVATDKEAIKSLISEEMYSGHIGVGVHLVAQAEATNDGMNNAVVRPQLGSYLDITDETFNKLKNNVSRLKIRCGDFESSFRFDYRHHLDRETYDFPDNKTIGNFDLYGSAGRRLHIDEFVWGQILNNAAREERRTNVFIPSGTGDRDFSAITARRVAPDQLNRIGDLSLNSPAMVEKFVQSAAPLPYGRANSAILSREANWGDLMMPNTNASGYPTQEVTYTIEFLDGSSFSGSATVEVRPTFSTYTASRLLRKDEDGWRYGFIKYHA